MARKALLDKIKSEIEGDKRGYLENCKNNYSEYVEAAQILFEEYYKSMLKLLDEKKDPYTLYISKAIKCKEEKDMDREKKYLKLAIENNADTPYAYERLAILYSKEKNYQEAYNICKKWFDSLYWKIPNMASTSLRLLDRMEKLEGKLNK
jgi:Tfp pilus assembly protein PilF